MPREQITKNKHDRFTSIALKYLYSSSTNLEQAITSVAHGPILNQKYTTLLLFLCPPFKHNCLSRYYYLKKNCLWIHETKNRLFNAHAIQSRMPNIVRHPEPETKTVSVYVPYLCVVTLVPNGS